MALTKEFLLQKLWESCTFDEIINAGLEKGCIGAETLINAASEYDYHKDIDDKEEIEELVENSDVRDIMEVLETRFTTKEIIDCLRTDDVLECFDFDWDIYEYYKGDIDEKCISKYNDGYEDGCNDTIEEIEKTKELNPLKDGFTDDKWKFLCDTFGLSYYDEEGLYKKLTEFIRELNKSTYKNKKYEQWSHISIDR